MADKKAKPKVEKVEKVVEHKIVQPWRRREANGQR